MNREIHTIRWKRPDDGFVESHCGHWKITPLYWGCTRAQMFELWRDGKKVTGYCSTQKEAKRDANRINRAEAARPCLPTIDGLSLPDDRVLNVGEADDGELEHEE